VDDAGDRGARRRVSRAVRATCEHARQANAFGFDSLWLADPDPTGDFDATALVKELREHVRAWDLDTAVVDLPAGLKPAARLRAIRALGTYVRPRMVMHELPHGIEDHWIEELPAALAAVADDGETRNPR
jgi:hypothetical protein